MNSFSKKETILLFGFVLLLLITWPKQGTAGTTYTKACQTAGSCDCIISDYCTANAQCLGNLCSYSCPAAGANSSLSSNTCSPGTSNTCHCNTAVQICDSGSCSCTISGNCTYSCDAGWGDANSNPLDGCETPAAATYTLTVSKAGTGSGTVTGPSINCGSDCSESYSSGTSVTLTATPDAGSVFAGWSGDSDCSDGVVTMNASKSCTATFTLTTAISPPTVSTSAATDITSSQARLNGSINNTGGENADELGFEWGTSPGGPYPNNWTALGSFGTGSLGHPVTGLTSGTTYYFRMKAHNSAGWGYGSERSFTTSAAATPCTSDGCNGNCPAGCGGADDPDCAGQCLQCTCATDNDCTNSCAAGDGCCSGCTPIDPDCHLINPLACNTFSECIEKIISFIFWIAVAIVPIMIIVAGFFFLTSGGDPEKIRTAKKVIIYACIGLAIVLFAKGIISVIKTVIGG